MPSYQERIAEIAREELKNYGGLAEANPKMLARIVEYCSALGFGDPGPIERFAWSATFVSWCAFTAGAVKAEFKFSIRHAVFVKAAIANADGNTGVFRARRIDAYKPKLGDLIHFNRENGTITYDQARSNDNYPSHSAIVVDLRTIGGQKYAITIGGNESNTIKESRHKLTAKGVLEQKAKNPYICVVETLKGASAAAVESASAALALPAAFRGHGTFVYSVPATVRDYGSVKLTIEAMQRLGMSHAWVRIHGRTGYGGAEKKEIKAFIDALSNENIAVAGWGWNQGEDPGKEADRALSELAAFGLENYVADIEHGHNNSQWTAEEIVAYCKAVRAGVKGGFGITTFALIDWHVPALMQAALPYVDMFNPQVYWFDFPDAKMVAQFKRPDGSKYPKDDPAAYADLCLQRWDRLVGGAGKALVMTGQAYWNEGGMTQAHGEEKLESFLAQWSNFGAIVGLNWWHFGGGSAMSHRMMEAIAAAKLGKRPYRKGSK